MDNKGKTRISVVRKVIGLVAIIGILLLLVSCTDADDYVAATETPWEEVSQPVSWDTDRILARQGDMNEKLDRILEQLKVINDKDCRS